MNNSEWKRTCDEVKSIDMVNYLSSLGYKPEKIRENDYWYLSPFRNERTASFKINRVINRWYDHGTGKGGNLIDFAILYHNCTIAELLQNLKGAISFRQASFHHLAQINPENKIRVLQDFAISSPSLLGYLKQRNIRFEIADQYCREVRYQVGEKIYYSIGFKNDTGGFELRNPYFKNSSSPKAITTFKNGAAKCAVFEGFFDFLSFLFFIPAEQHSLWDFCILNSLSFFQKARTFLQQYNAVHLFLDNDTAGQNCSQFVTQSDKKYIDESRLYEGYKDLNEWIVNMGKQNKSEEKENPP